MRQLHHETQPAMFVERLFSGVLGVVTKSNWWRNRILDPDFHAAFRRVQKLIWKLRRQC
jgi:hypothetical protein